MARAVLRIRLSDPTLKILLDDEKLKKLATDEDLRAAGERERARIIDRTMRGVDVHGRAFAPYSSKGPYYFYPAGPNRSTISRKRSARRLAKILGGTLTSSGLGIRFDGGYAEFKRRIGRGPAVDLMGPRAPHMLQSMVVWVSQGEIHIGFYDAEKAKIAAAHNKGAMTGRGHKVKLPQREFFGVSREERDLIRSDISRSVRERLRNKTT